MKSLSARIILISVILLFINIITVTSQSFSSDKDFKETAIAEFKAANYHAAIGYLEKALEGSPNDAEIYYLLGYYKHYLCYDSIPLMGFGRESSDEVLRYLQKAVELDPNYGNAYYFIGAEYGARARDEMQERNAESAVEQFRLGKEAGGYPPWMIEYGRNALKSCDRDAILFTGGDAETNPMQYLQCVDNYRTDVTVIPVALLDRPWFVSLLKLGLGDIVRPVRISWSNQQIQKMRPYKWKTNILSIPVPEALRAKRNLKETAIKWEIEPNLGGGKDLNLLSASRAVFADIVITNDWDRPIYFSFGCRASIREGLEKYIISSGFAMKLLPYESGIKIDAEKTKALLLDGSNFKYLTTVRNQDMPRVSHILGNYRVLYFLLINNAVQAEDFDSARELFSAMRRNVPEDAVPMHKGLKTSLDDLESRISNLKNK